MKYKAEEYRAAYAAIYSGDKGDIEALDRWLEMLKKEGTRRLTPEEVDAMFPDAFEGLGTTLAKVKEDEAIMFCVADAELYATQDGGKTARVMCHVDDWDDRDWPLRTANALA